VQQPQSVVQLQNTVDLSRVTADGNYSIWLQRGTSGNWYPINGVDATNRKLTVLGEARFDTATSYTIRRARQHYIHIRGPIAGDTHHLAHYADWDLDATRWGTLYSAWQAAVTATPKTQTPPLFTEWLTNPASSSRHVFQNSAPR